MEADTARGTGPGGGCGPAMERMAMAARMMAGEWARGGGHRGRPGRSGGGRPGGGPFGSGGPFGGGFGWGGFRGGPRARRGDVRAAALLLLAEEPRNGYQIMQAISERSQDLWRPSPGAVYPALQQLEDEGLIAARDEGGQRRFHLTDAGRAHVAAHQGEMGTPWDAVVDSVDDDVHALLQLARQSGAALLQVAHLGTPAQVGRAAEVLKETRRALYRILAEDGPVAPGEGGAAPAADRS
ncbi:MAG TPA: PadR family transcriptional regulator [Verrucomicrobiae bacterium]|nr:PadR family transcriptional regulator [Verrucomicrobiae bacterium]